MAIKKELLDRLLADYAYSTESDHRFHASSASDSIDSGQGVGA